MSSTPYARLLLSIDGGAATAGGVEAAAEASVQLVYESTAGWPATPPPYAEVFEAPPGWEPDPIVGWVEGAAASAAQLRGVANFLEDTMTEPQAARDLLEITAQAAIRFALAQLEAGADMIGLGDAVCSLLSPRAYREFGLPYEQRIIRAIHEAGGKVKLHICGNTTRHLADMAQTGADIVDVDWMVPYAEAIRLMPGISVNGNFDPVGVLLQGTPEQVAEAVRACHAARDDRSMISAGCEVPVGTPAENLLAHHRVLVEAGA